MLFNKKPLLQYIILWMLLLTPFILRGQIKKKGENQMKAVPLEHILKLGAASLVDPFGPTCTAYLEHQLSTRKKWTSLEHEIGYTFKVTGLTKEAYGYRFRSAYRQYWKNKWKEHNNGYVSFALMHRQFFDAGNEFLWRSDRNYQQNLSYHLRITQQFALINIGNTRYFGPKNCFNLDISMGLGARRSRVLFTGLPDDAITPTVPDVYERNFKEYVGQTTVKDRTHFFYATALSLKLGYVFQKNSLADKKK